MKRLLAMAASAVVATSFAAAAAQAAPPVLDGTVNIIVYVNGTEAANIDTTWIPELYASGTDVFGDDCGLLDDYDDLLDSGRWYVCGVAPGTYDLGFPSTPSNYYLDSYCYQGGGIEEVLPGEQNSVTVEAGVEYTCEIRLRTNMVLVDKYLEAPEGVETGVDEFVIELYDDTGAMVGSATDPDPAECGSLGDYLSGACGIIEVLDGEYFLGEADGVMGFMPVDWGCSDIRDVALEVFDASGESDLSVFSDGEGNEVFTCGVLNAYYESAITVTKTVVNDDGGTSTPSAWTMELYDNADALVATGVCDDTTGVCIDGDFPIGDYTVGQTGPDGYTHTINVTSLFLPTERIDDPAAEFTVERFAEYSVEVVSDDVTTTTSSTTTTTTTTVAPTTTQGPTTTAVGAAVVTLPSTGSTERSGQVAALAALLVVFGAGALAMSRRRT